MGQINWSELNQTLDEIDHSFEREPIGGFTFALYHRGELVAHRAGGKASESKDFTEQTLAVAFSCTKGLVTILIGRLVDQGMLDLDTPVSHYWPEFSRISPDLTVSELMQHRAGLSAPRANLTFAEAISPRGIVASLLEQEPLWKPGTGYAYHALTFGSLLQELAIRVSGKTLGQLLQSEIARPLGVDAHIGVPAELQPSVAQLVAKEKYLTADAAPDTPAYWQERAITLGGAFPVSHIGKPGLGFNSPECQQAELPGANGIMTAEALAKIWSAAVTTTDGVRLLTDETIDKLTELKVDEPTVWGEEPYPLRGVGVMLHTPGFREFLSDASFGHDGLGGQVGFADRKHQIGFGYITNLLRQGDTEHVSWFKLVAKVRSLLD